MRLLMAIAMTALLLSGCARQATAPIACGTEDRGHGAEWNTEVRRCVWNALNEGKQPEFTTSILTTEGDPIIHKVRSLPKGRAEVTVDTTRDKFGEQKITVYTCSDLVATDSQGKIRFHVTGCKGGPQAEFQF